MKNKILSTLIIIPSLMLISCSQDISSNTYQYNQVGEINNVYFGTIKSISQVTVKSNNELKNNGQGIIIGGIAGAAAGSAITDSNKGTMFGALFGAAIGASVEQKAKKQNAFKIQIQLQNDKIIEVVQGTDQKFYPGQHVSVSISDNGYARVLPR